MDTKYTLYKIIGEQNKYAIPVCHCRTLEAAEKIAANMKKTEPKKGRIDYLVNPVLCIACLNNGIKTVAANGCLFCEFHQKAETEKFLKESS